VHGIADYPAFVLAALVFQMIPGPGTFAVLAATARGGPRGGYAALAGLMLGDWLLMTAAMIGVAALLSTHPPLFKAMQFLGLGYLAWVGLQLLLASRAGAAATRAVPTGAHFRQSLLITLINPKAIVFYMAFLPLFIDPLHYQGVTTLAAMGATIAALTVLYGSLLIWGGHWAARRLRANRRFGRWLSRAAGIALIGFGLRLATD
jgi:threonine/homoserine/homoserine lactone efflux protein